MFIQLPSDAKEAETKEEAAAENTTLDSSDQAEPSPKRGKTSDTGSPKVSTVESAAAGESGGAEPQVQEEEGKDKTNEKEEGGEKPSPSNEEVKEGDEQPVQADTKEEEGEVRTISFHSF